MKNVFEKTELFRKWLDSLSDQKGRARILTRIVAAEAGNFGDYASAGGGVMEMRIHFCPGSRVYYAQRWEVYPSHWREATRALRSAILPKQMRCGKICRRTSNDQDKPV